jgi:uncharacterized protein YbjT (DUF2867 family)
MILVTGATGTVGSALVRELLARDVEVFALTRDPAKIEPRPGLTVTTTAQPADAVFLLAPPGPGAPEIDLELLSSALKAGAGRVVKLSAIGTPDEPDPGSVFAWHQPGEQAVRESGVPWTILRPTVFATNTLAWAADIRAGRPIANLFGDGEQGVIDPADIAAVAAVALTEPGHDGHVYTLTGPELITVPEQVAQLAEVLGIPITTVDVQPTAELFPPELAEVALRGAEMVRAGGNAIVTADTERVLGRPPHTYREWAAANRERF